MCHTHMTHMHSWKSPCLASEAFLRLRSITSLGTPSSFACFSRSDSLLLATGSGPPALTLPKHMPCRGGVWDEAAGLMQHVQGQTCIYECSTVLLCMRICVQLPTPDANRAWPSG